MESTTYEWTEAPDGPKCPYSMITDDFLPWECDGDECFECPFKSLARIAAALEELAAA